MPREIAACVERANLDPEVHVIALSGNGKGFCGGYDLVMSAEQRRPGGDAVPTGSPLDPAVQMQNHDPAATWDPMVDYQMIAHVRGFKSLLRVGEELRFEAGWGRGEVGVAETWWGACTRSAGCDGDAIGLVGGVEQATVPQSLRSTHATCERFWRGRCSSSREDALGERAGMSAGSPRWARSGWRFRAGEDGDELHPCPPLPVSGPCRPVSV